MTLDISALNGWPMATMISLAFTGVFFLFYRCCIRPEPLAEYRYDTFLFVCLLAFGLGIRILVALLVYGHPTDMQCWMSWSETAKGTGLFSIYRSEIFVDYPPGYMFVLHLIGNIRQLFGIPVVSQMHSLIIKIPPMLADIAATCLIYRFALPRSGRMAAIGLASIYLFNPAVILNSSAWGQVDAVLALAVLGYVYSLYHKQMVKASVFFAIGILIKPQMLFFSPLLMVVFIRHLQEDGWKMGIRTFLKGFSLALGIFVLTALPFGQGLPWHWILGLYFSAIGSYDYINLNTCNLFMLLGLNWVPNSEKRLGIPLGLFGYLGIGLSVLLYMGLEYLNRKRELIFLGGTLLMTGIFTFGAKMHERYLFPVMILLLFAYVLQKDRKILFLYLLVAISHFLNIYFVLAIPFLPAENIYIKAVSLMTVVAYVWVLLRYVKTSSLVLKKKYNENDDHPLRER
ncbi:MAG: hypothetical protein R6W96_00210 [Clostridia bacterium]